MATRKKRKMVRRKRRTTILQRTIKGLSKPENIISLLGSVVVPLFVLWLDHRRIEP